jgi:predicted PurR-regulated permease PerM
MTFDRNLILWVLGLAVFTFVVWLLRDVLLPFAGGIALAYMQAPLADWLERRGMSRTVASLFIVSAAVLTLVLLMLVLAPLLSEQAIALMAGIRDYVGQLQGHLANSKSPWLRQILGADANKALPELLGQGSGYLNGVAGSLWSGGKALISFVSVIVIMPVITFYLICDWHQMVATLDSWIPPRHRPAAHQIVSEIDAAISGFLRGQAAICLITGIYYATALSQASPPKDAVMRGILDQLWTGVGDLLFRNARTAGAERRCRGRPRACVGCRPGGLAASIESESALRRLELLR